MNGHEVRRRRTRAAILTSAARLFEGQGYTSTTVAQIASQAGVSERSFYVHFPSKEDLLFGHMQEVGALACEVANRGTGGPVERTDRAIRAMIQATTQDPVIAQQAQVRVMLAETGRLPKSLAAQLLALADSLIQTIAGAADVSFASVAPAVGAALGAVQAAGHVAARDGNTPSEMRTRMEDALYRSLLGFK